MTTNSAFTKENTLFLNKKDKRKYRWQFIKWSLKAFAYTIVLFGAIVYSIYNIFNAYNFFETMFFITMVMIISGQIDKSFRDLGKQRQLIEERITKKNKVRKKQHEVPDGTFQ